MDDLPGLLVAGDGYSMLFLGDALNSAAANKECESIGETGDTDAFELFDLEELLLESLFLKKFILLDLGGAYAYGSICRV